MTVQSKERVIALKELSLYANSSPQAAIQLQSLSTAKHAAQSLESTDPKVLMAALFLAQKIISHGSALATRQFLDSNGGNLSLKLLASIDVAQRVDTLKVFA